MPKFNELDAREQSVFKAFLEYTVQNQLTCVTEGQLGRLDAHGVPPVFVRSYLEKLTIKEVLWKHGGEDGDSIYWEMNLDFAEEALSVGEQLGILPADSSLTTAANVNNSSIPAADRFVNIDHNSVEFKEADQALEELVKGVQTANDLPLRAEDREVIAAEIGAVRKALQAARVRIAWVLGAIRSSGPIAWLLEQTSSGSVKAFAQKAAEKIMALFL